MAGLKTQLLGAVNSRNEATLVALREAARALKISSADYVETVGAVAGSGMIAPRVDAVIAARETAGIEETSGLEGALRSSVHSVETRLREFPEEGTNLDGLMVQMLMLRRHEKDFIMRGTEKYIKRFTDRIARFREVLAAAPAGDEDKAVIDTLIGDYDAGFMAWVKASLALKEAERAALDAVDVSLAALGDQKAAAQGAFASSADTARLTFDTIRSYMLVAIIVAAVFVVSIATIIGQSISRPLLALVRAVRKLEKGLYDKVVPGRDRGDEIGHLAAAVDTLRQTGQQVASLQEEETRKEAARAAERKKMLAALSDSFRDVVDAAAVGDFSKRVSTETVDPEILDLAKKASIPC